MLKINPTHFGHCTYHSLLVNVIENSGKLRGNAETNRKNSYATFSVGASVANTNKRYQKYMKIGGYSKAV